MTDILDLITAADPDSHNNPIEFVHREVTTCASAESTPQIVDRSFGSQYFGLSAAAAAAQTATWMPESSATLPAEDAGTDRGQRR